MESNPPTIPKKVRRPPRIFPQPISLPKNLNEKKSINIPTSVMHKEPKIP
jgi:hypothetical protein